MIFQALPDVDLALLDMLSYKIDFPLESWHWSHKLCKSSFNVKGGRHSMWWWCSYCREIWWRLRNSALTLMPQLSIRLRESVYAKGIWDPWVRLSVWNICHDPKTDLSDQTPKRQTRVLLIANLEHSVQDVLAQAKRNPHHDGIEKGGLLESKLTPRSLRPKVCHHNLY
jgi:hypothetical protein